MTIIVDSSSICYQAKHTLDLSYEGNEVGDVFGFLRKIISLAKIFKTNDFIITCDSKTSIRKEHFPGYKGKRHQERTEQEKEFDALCYRQFNELKESVIPNIGLLSYSQEGYEADDLIASIIQNEKKDIPFLIISTDNDLYQLLSDRVSLYNKVEFSKGNFEDEYNIPPNQWIYVKAIAGCDSDSIPGIPTIGTKTAIKYLKKELKITSAAHQKIVSNKELIDFNLPLVSLPYPGTTAIKLPQYGFRSMLEKEYLEKCKTILSLQ